VKSAIPITLFLLSLSGCQEAPPPLKFGHDRDNDRKSRLLPIIEDFWVASKRNDDETTWAAESVTDVDPQAFDIGLPQYPVAQERHVYGPGAHYTAKTVSYSGDNLQGEEGLYSKSIDSHTHKASETRLCLECRVQPGREKARGIRRKNAALRRDRFERGRKDGSLPCGSLL
jgi:hypothetical protein